MPLRREQSATGADTTFASSVTATFSNTTQAGSIILLAWEGDSATAINKANTPTDTAGNIYIRVVSVINSGSFDLEIWYAVNKASTASNAVTVTDTLAGADGTLIIEEWTGDDPLTVVDKSSSNSGSSNTLTPSNISTIQPNELIWVAGVNAVGANDLSASGSNTNLTQVSTGFSNLGIASQVVASIGSFNSGFTTSAGAVSWACAQVAIRRRPEGTTTSTSSTSSTTFSTSSTSSSISTSSTSFSSTSTSVSTSSTSISTSSTSSSISSTSSSTSSTSTSSTSSSTSISSTSSSISSTSQSSTSQSSTSSSSSISSTSSSFSSTSSSVSSTSASTSSTSFSSTSSSSSTSTTALPLNLDYSYQDSLTLPSTSTDDIDPDSNKNVQNVAVDDSDYFIRRGSEYTIQTLKKTWTNNTANPTLTWKGRSTESTLVSPILVQIYNQNSATWETLATVNTIPADTDFKVSVTQAANVANYYNSNNVVTFRIYQQVI